MREAIKNDKRQTIGYADKSGSKTIIYDLRQSRIGEIREESGKLVAYDSHQKRLAVYEEKMDVTKDARLTRIGKGNLLVRVIFQNALGI